MSSDPSIAKRVHLIRYDSVDSTNRVATDLGYQGAEEWTVVHALEQTAGRGRHKNEWFSPRGNLFLSAVLKPKVKFEKWSELSFVISLAVADTVEDLIHNSSIALKWPNDVLVNQKKIAGILLESALNAKKESFLIAGVGVNITCGPVDARYGATWIDELALEKKSVETVLSTLIDAMIDWYDIWETSGFEKIRKRWLERAYGVGKRVMLADKAPQLREGIYNGISGDGRMILKKNDGTEEIISSGTLTFL